MWRQSPQQALNHQNEPKADDKVAHCCPDGGGVAAGLPDRPWYRHVIYAPGLYTGYGVKTIPGVREAIEQKRWQEADQQIQRVGRAG